jgi:hypothetical protein
MLILFSKIFFHGSDWISDLAKHFFHGQVLVPIPASCPNSKLTQK